MMRGGLTISLPPPIWPSPWLDGLHNGQPFRRHPGNQFCGWFIAETMGMHSRHIADSNHPTLTGVKAEGGTMTERIVKEQRITCLKVDFDRPFELFAGAGADRTAAILAGMWEVGLVAAGNDDGGAIS